jgi:hypothetical protein
MAELSAAAISRLEAELLRCKKELLLANSVNVDTSVSH